MAVKEINSEEAIQLLNKGALFVDVREHSEVEEAAFDVSSILIIPMGVLGLRTGEIPKDRDIVVVCRVGERSRIAGNYLLNHGFDNVYNLTEGIRGWIEKDFPHKGELGPAPSCSGGGCC